MIKSYTTFLRNQKIEDTSCPSFWHKDEDDEEYFNKLRDKLDELFPKGECCSCGKKLPCRSKAIVLNAYANIYHKENEDRCIKCGGKFEPHHHKHITRKGIYHTKCYKDAYSNKHTTNT